MGKPSRSSLRSKSSSLNHSKGQRTNGSGPLSPPARLRRLGVRQPQDKESEDLINLEAVSKNATFLDNRDKANHRRDNGKLPLVPLGRKTALNCEKCHRYFLSYHGYDSHLETHENKAVRCWNCNIRFQTNRSLVIHHRRRHREDAKNRGLETLEFIDFSCKTFPYIIRHFCEKNPAELSSHPYNFHKYSCRSCRMNFPMKAALELHNKSTHPDGAAFNCQLCNQEFFDEMALDHHSKKYSNRKHSPLKKRQLTEALCLIPSCALDKDNLNGKDRPEAPNYDYYRKLRQVERDVRFHYQSAPVPDATDSDSSQSS